MKLLSKYCSANAGRGSWAYGCVANTFILTTLWYQWVNRELKPLNSERVSATLSSVCSEVTGGVTPSDAVTVSTARATVKGAYYPQLVVGFAMGNIRGRSRICPSCKVGGVCFSVCLSWLLVCVCVCVQCPPCVTRQSQVFWEGRWHNAAPICLWLSGGHREGTVSGEGSALHLRCMTSCLLQAEGAPGL